MKTVLPQTAENLKIAGRYAGQALIVLGGLAALGILELAAFRYAHASATDQAANLKGWLSIAFAFLAFVCSMATGWIADDPRREVRDRALVCRIAAIMLLFLPVMNLSGFMALDRDAKAFDAYAASPAFPADQALAADMMADSRVRAEAALRLTPPTAAQREAGDWGLALILHALVMMAASVFRLPRPMTQADIVAMELERKRRNQRERRKQRERAKRVAKRDQAAGGNVLPMRKV